MLSREPRQDTLQDVAVQLRVHIVENHRRYLSTAPRQRRHGREAQRHGKELSLPGREHLTCWCGVHDDQQVVAVRPHRGDASRLLIPSKSREFLTEPARDGRLLTTYDAVGSMIPQNGSRQTPFHPRKLFFHGLLERIERALAEVHEAGAKNGQIALKRIEGGRRTAALQQSVALLEGASIPLHDDQGLRMKLEGDPIEEAAAVLRRSPEQQTIG